MPETPEAIRGLADTMITRFTPPSFVPGCEVQSVADIDEYTTNNGWIEAIVGGDNQQRVRYYGTPEGVKVGDFIDAEYFPAYKLYRVFGATLGGTAVTGGVRVDKVWESDFGAVALRADAIGQIGIGTATPVVDLTIDNSVGGQIRLRDTSAPTTTYLNLNGGNVGVNRATIDTGSATNLDIKSRGNDAISIVDSGGVNNVGIGTTSPEGKLHVQIASAGVAPAIDADAAVFEFTAGAGSDGLSVLFPDNRSAQWVFGTPSDNDAGRIRYGGPTVGTVADRDSMQFYTAGAEAFRIDVNQNVGIGIVTPLAQLHVDQPSATAAEPVLLLDQADVSEGMRQFETTIGVGNAIEATGLKLLTVTHFVKDTLPGGLALYTPYGTISETGPTHTKSTTVTTQGLGANPDIFAFGYYEWSGTAAILTQASPTQTFGTANISYAAHAFAVTSIAGSADAGVVGLRVNGTSINDQGTRTTSDTETIIADITAVSLNDYVETAKKWLGQVTFELFTISGSPTTFNLSFNYGLAKYDDWFNNDFTITDIECVGFAGANDSNFDIKLMHHQTTGWTYSAGAFTPITAANTIASLVTDHSTDDQLSSSQHASWKRDDLATTINGSGNEGFLVFISSSANNAIEYMNLHVGVVF